MFFIFQNKNIAAAAASSIGALQAAIRVRWAEIMAKSRRNTSDMRSKHGENMVKTWRKRGESLVNSISFVRRGHARWRGLGSGQVFLHRSAPGEPAPDLEG